MTPTDILTPVVLVLALVGYVACFERFFWLTAAATVALAGVMFALFGYTPEALVAWVACGTLALLAALAGWVLRRRSRGPAGRVPGRGKSGVVVDGTNVIYWGGEPDLGTLRAVVDQLRRKGRDPYVFLDASTRHHLRDKALDEAGFARALGLKRSRITVCPARTEADAFILKFAREHRFPVVSNDRFGDRATEVAGLKLIKGGVAGGKPILHGV